MRTKHQARKLAKQLTESGIPSVDLHGNLSQPARERNLARFAAGSARVLVATDIAARGVHVDEVELVVHIDPPSEHKSYLHRSGAPRGPGAPVTSSRWCCPSSAKIPGVAAQGRHQNHSQQVTAMSEAVQALVGEVAPYQAPVPAGVPARQHRQNTGGNRRRRTNTRSPKTSSPPKRRHRTTAPPRRVGWIVAVRAAHKEAPDSRGPERVSGAPAARPGPLPRRRRSGSVRRTRR